MKKQNFILLFIVTFLNSGCYTYKVFPKEYRKLENGTDKKNAYLINDSLKKEAEILKYSDIFNITTDSTKADLKIKLYPIERNWVCGQPLTLSMITIGQMPVYLPDLYFFKFDEIQKDIIVENKMQLKLAKRVWFWDMFGFNKRFEEKAGKALLGNYLNNK